MIKNTLSISSSANKLFRYWKGLLQGPRLKKASHFLLSGHRLGQEFLKHHQDSIESLLILPHHQSQLEQLEQLEQIQTENFSIYLLTTELFNQLNPFGTKGPLFIVRQPEITFWNQQLPAQSLEVFSALGDPANLGALLRCCEAFSVSSVILLKESAHPFHPKSVRSSSGSCFRVKMQWGPSINEDLGYHLSLDKSGKALPQFSWPNHCRLLLGEEGLGLPSLKKKEAGLLQIPITPSMDSLNAVSAASIALFHYRLQHPLAP